MEKNSLCKVLASSFWGMVLLVLGCTNDGLFEEENEDVRSLAKRAMHQCGELWWKRRGAILLNITHT